jgi:hypothetical protein
MKCIKSSNSMQICRALFKHGYVNFRRAPFMRKSSPIFIKIEISNCLFLGLGLQVSLTQNDALFMVHCIPAPQKFVEYYSVSELLKRYKTLL